jgi:DNA-binding MarR family transcriptional regulator
MANRVHKLVDVSHDSAILRTFILFVQTAYTVLKYADAHFYRAARLSTIKFIVLKALAVNGGSMTPSKIAEWTFKERHNITTLVDRLKREGLVRAERSNKDKRFVNIILTAKGRRVLKQATPVAREIVDQVMLSFSEGDAVLLEKSLRILRQNAHSSIEQLAKLSRSQAG